MSCECIDIVKGTSWFDTVDQEHIPLEIINNCDFDANLNINVSTNQEMLYSARIRIPSLSKHKIEIITDKYYEALNVNIGLIKEENKEICRKSIKILLR
jgi:hypothetical protein